MSKGRRSGPPRTDPRRRRARRRPSRARAGRARRARPAGVRRVLGRLVDGVEGGGAFEDLEAVRGDEVGLGGLVHAVVGAADALHDPARALGRADVDDEVHVAPVDAEVEGRGADHGLELAFDHRRLDAPALGDVEGAVVEGDGERVLVQAPERLEDVLRLHAGVDEDERGLWGADEVVDRRHGERRRVTRPSAGAGRASACGCRAWRRLRP